ncbi:MAG: hypothetical protein DRG83_01865 [Deltaproteobacteria bacterium]|nr:MAG: hypothetical protein DRG83_01865 [Deltaproteobacteria bacterium]
MRLIKKALMGIYSLKRFLTKESECPIKMNLATRLRMWRLGFLGESYFIYSFSKNNPKNYISDFLRFYKVSLINGSFSILLDNKILFERVINSLTEKPIVPFNLLYIKDGRFFPLRISIEDWRKRFEKGERFVLKPVSGGGGFNVKIIKYEKGKAIVNGAKVVVSQFYKELQRLDNYIITEFVNQAEYSKEIYPYTVNTIRILTMWDYENSIPFIAIAVHRIGTQRSYPVDNWTQGGMSAHINIETGELGPGVTYPFDGKLRFYSRHPETDSPIQGVRVPNWEKVRETVLKLASNLPFLPYIAWDVVLDENKNIRIIEGNSNTDVNLLQVHKPFLSDARIKKFYSYHGVL